MTQACSVISCSLLTLPKGAKGKQKQLCLFLLSPGSHTVRIPPTLCASLGKRSDSLPGRKGHGRGGQRFPLLTPSQENLNHAFGTTLGSRRNHLGEVLKLPMGGGVRPRDPDFSVGCGLGVGVFKSSQEF